MWKRKNSNIKLLSLGAEVWTLERSGEMASKIVLVTVLSLFCVTLVLCSEPVKNGEAATGAYDTKYDNIDLEELLRNDRLRKNYVKCLLGQGPCTPDGLELKSKSHSSNNPFSIITERITRLKDFLYRFTTRRDSHRLLKMHGEAKKWFANSNILSNW